MIKAKAGISIEPIGIADILHRWQLAVPLNQRAYKWEDEEIEKLFQDLTKAFDKQPMYFLGTVMFTQGGKGQIEVADGQQRLATVSILLSAVRDYLIELGDAEGAKTYETDFLIKYDPPTGSYKPRLKLNQQDDAFFHEHVLLPPSKRVSERVPYYTSNERIKSAAKQAKQHVRDITAGLSNTDKTRRLYDWVEYLKTDALIIVVTVPSEVGNSFKMFETLNARGVPATQVDILKNFLFDRAPDDSQRVNAHWLSMITAIESYGNDNLVLSYIRHLWVSMYGPTTVDELGSSVEGRIKNQRNALDFVGILDSTAATYLGLLTPLQSPRWEGLSSNARKALDIISNEFKAEQIRPLMLSVAQRFPIPEIEKCFNMFLSWSVRFLIVGGGGGGKLDRYYGLRAKEITEGGISSARALAESMTEVVPGDRQFEEEFSRASVSKSNLARYYLRAIEAYRARDPLPQLLINEDPNAVNLEHILPVTPSKDWNVDVETLAAFHKRIGNMVLLGSKLNVAVGQNSFTVKRSVFKKSPLATTSEVSSYDVWGPDQIRDRQKQLAASAPKVWPLTWK